MTRPPTHSRFRLGLSGLWFAVALGIWFGLAGLAVARERAVVGALEVVGDEADARALGDDLLADIRARSPIHVGDLYDPQVLRDFVKALYAREVFGQIRVLREEPEEGVVSLTVKVSLRPEIRRIRLKGNRVFGDSELLRALRMREGDRFESDDLADEEARLLQYLRRQGYVQAKVSFVGSKRKDGGIEILGTVTEGRPRRVSRLAFFGQSPFSERFLASRFDVHIGDVVEVATLTRAAGKLRDLLQQAGYREARIEVTGLNDTQTEENPLFARGVVQVHVECGRRVDIEFVGNAHYRQSELVRALKIGTETVLNYDATTQERLRKELLNFYLREGYLWARVAVGVGLPEAGRKRVRFRIVEGRRVKLEALHFLGVERRLAKQLRGELLAFLRDRLVKEDEDGFGPLEDGKPEWNVPAVERPLLAPSVPPPPYGRPERLDADEIFEPSLMAESARILEQVLHEQGYLAAAVGEPQLSVSATGQRLRVDYAVETGRQTRIVSRRIVGVHVLSGEELERAFLPRLGQPLNETLFAESQKRLSAAYEAKGYIYAQSDVSYTLTPDGRGARLLLALREGPRVRVGEILVSGARKTRLKTILDELTFREGDVYLPSEFEESRRFLQKLSIFQVVNFKSLNPEREEPKKNVVVTVTERKPGHFELSGGLGTDEGVRGSVGVVYRNIGGLALEFHSKARLNHRIPALLDSEFAKVYRTLAWKDSLEREISLGFYYPSMLGSHIGMRTDLVHLRRQERSHGLDKNAVQLSFDTQMVRGLTIAQINEFAWQKVQRTALPNWNPAAIIPPDGESYELSPKLQVLYDYRDNLFSTTRGVSLSLLGEYFKTIAGSLSTNLFRESLTLAGYVPIPAWRQPMVLRISGRLGLISNLEGGQTPVDKRFKLGGRVSLRGFDEDAVYPGDLSAAQKAEIRANKVPSPGGDALLLFKLDWRIPVYKGFFLGAFLDSGNLWISARNIDLWLNRYKNSAGGGLHYRTPVGDISLELGFNLHRQRSVPEDAWRLHFSISLF